MPTRSHSGVLARFSTRQRMVAGFGDTAQVDRVLVLVADDEPDQVDIERAALGKILHGVQSTAWLARVTLKGGL